MSPLNVQNGKIADFPYFPFPVNEKPLRTPCSYMYFTSYLKSFAEPPSFTVTATA